METFAFIVVIIGAATIATGLVKWFISLDK